MATVSLPNEQRFVLGGVTWREYLRWLRMVEGRHVRLTYDRGELELMTLSPLHEWLASLFGQFVEVLTEELNRPRLSAGSTTLKRKLRRRGLEADRSYYLANEPLIRGKNKIDLRRDPPPDLAIEVDVSHSSLKRMPIYAALKVPEVWRFDGFAVEAHHLGHDGKYHRADYSLSFPFLRVAELLPFIQLRMQMDETSLIRSFREWVRQRIAQGWSGRQGS